jgi:hypothetical protein
MKTLFAILLLASASFAKNPPACDDPDTYNAGWNKTDRKFKHACMTEIVSDHVNRQGDIEQPPAPPSSSAPISAAPLNSSSHSSCTSTGTLMDCSGSSGDYSWNSSCRSLAGTTECSFNSGYSGPYDSPSVHEVLWRVSDQSMEYTLMLSPAGAASLPADFFQKSKHYTAERQLGKGYMVFTLADGSIMKCPIREFAKLKPVTGK